jgi:hypothetical protein
MIWRKKESFGMKRIWFTAIAALGLLAAGPAPAQEAAKEAVLDGKTMPVKEFLEIVQYPRMLESWARLDGTVYHKSKGKDLKVPIELRARFTEKEWRMQIIVNNAERYLVRQIPADGVVGTSVIEEQPAPKDGVSLASLMLRPSDITLSFLYWDFDQELEPEHVSTMSCRVLQLKHPKTGETVRAWIATEFFFPLRVAWYAPKATEPYRQLDFKGTQKITSSVDPKHQFVMVNEVTITNPGWKTRVVFDQVKGDEVTGKLPEPKDLFIKTAPADPPAAPKPADQPADKP